jgi:hypothetical protein
MSDPMPSAKSEPEWAAFAAVDWANQKHFWRLAPAESQQQEQGELENTPEAPGDVRIGEYGFAKWRARRHA